jgi:hypothetical protein
MNEPPAERFDAKAGRDEPVSASLDLPSSARDTPLDRHFEEDPDLADFGAEETDDDLKALELEEYLETDLDAAPPAPPPSA